MNVTVISRHSRPTIRSFFCHSLSKRIKGKGGHSNMDKMTWYINRMKKMSGGEIYKRLREVLKTYYSRFQYRNPSLWPYSRFADGSELIIRDMPGTTVHNDWKNFQIFNLKFDLTDSIDWLFSERPNRRWPVCHYSVLNYRQGNPYGSVRLNWELNRLQFLPTLAVVNEDHAKKIITSWLEKNTYLHGPNYISAMEVAIRWISIYRAICYFKKLIEPKILSDLTGLANASGKYIESHLSTHSSAGNHLIVEAVGLYWLGKAVENEATGKHWIEKARKILKEQIPLQINSDGSNQEQSFWYLGFVLDAIFHYILLEDPHLVPAEILNRVESSVAFISEMILENGAFPNYGDCDNGYIFRPRCDYSEPVFLNLIKIGNAFLGKGKDFRTEKVGGERSGFFKYNNENLEGSPRAYKRKKSIDSLPSLKTFHEGGMTKLRWEKGKILFRHARLGLGNTCGHGHADALSVLFYWQDVPVLIDLGSGQYDGDPKIRNYFRSTIAHNTVEIAGENQSKILGPFLWNKSYNANLIHAAVDPVPVAEAMHDGYLEKYGILSMRRISYSSPRQFKIQDFFKGPGGMEMRGAFHLGDCSDVQKVKKSVEADFGTFVFRICFPQFFDIEIFHGSQKPFIGWRSSIYGAWTPCFSIIFSQKLKPDHQYDIEFDLIEKRK